VDAREDLRVAALERLRAPALPVRHDLAARVGRIAAVLEAPGEPRVDPVRAVDLIWTDRAAAVTRGIPPSVGMVATLDRADGVEDLVERVRG
jgi:hypothetical protein